MSQVPKAKSRVAAERRPDAGDSVLILLDDRQWSYLQRRYDLTPRELQIADLVCRGLRNGRIARDLNIRPGTVKTHMKNIYRKVRVKSKINMLLRFVTEAHELTGPPHRASSHSFLK